MHALTHAEITQACTLLPHWQLHAEGNALQREFVLGDFMQAFAFMTHIALAAEKHNHHPEWRNVYNRVHITWTTHDAKGLTQRDITMAQLCDQVYAAGRS
jgi:4a-hydroxytetrahydrobiopterin dehydratase